MGGTHKTTRQLGFLSIPCPACGFEWTVWIDRDLWECPACAYEWREER